MTLLSPSALSEGVATALKDGANSSVIGGILRRQWQAGKEAAFETEKGGYAISRFLSARMDEIVHALAGHVLGPGMAVVATGGYGRGQLAPYSDIDLLFLARGGDLNARLAPFLYAMWDSGFPMSHSAHSPASAVTAAQADTVTRTAFLDARMICGDTALYEDFHERFDKLRRRTLAEFVEAKLRERDERHDRIASSRYAIEPDVKEGKGGLRDLDTLHWLNRYVTGLDDSPTFAVDAPGLFTPRELRRLNNVLDFFWSVRVELHRAQGRADERLSFSIQPILAERLGYRARSDASAVERFMRHYFLNAKEVGRLTRAASAQLEEQALKETRFAAQVKGAIDRMVEEQAFDGEANLIRRGGRITFADHSAALENPRALFALIRASGRHNLPLHPDAFQTAVRGARLLGAEDRQRPELRELFQDILRESQDLERVLRTMSECGLLGRFLPDFGDVIGKVEYSLFRRYTLDEHVLRAVGVLCDMLSDRDDGRFVLTKPMAKAFGDPMPLYVALLLQEAPSPSGEDEKEMLARIRREAAQVLDKPDDIDLVVFAIQHRDLLFRVASRRNVVEGSVVASLAKVIKTQRRLDSLSILTSCRHRTVGIRSWEEYARRDVRLLVETLQAYLDGGAEALDTFLEERRQKLRRQTRAMLAEADQEAFNAFIERTGPSFWSMADPSAAADLSLLVKRIEAEGHRGGAMVQEGNGGMLQVMLYTDNTPQVFALATGIVAEIGGSVFDASAFPLGIDVDGAEKAALIFQIQRAGPPPGPFEATPDEISAIRNRFDQMAQGTGPAPSVPSPVVGDRRSMFSVTPTIRVDEHGSEEALIVEVEALDRPGLLFDLASALADIGVNIQLAYIATYGERAVDTFYLQDAPHYKIDDGRRIEAIRRQILRVLQKEG